MKKLSSKLFENFKENEIINTSFIVGRTTTKKKACNTFSYDNDNSSWRKDSTDNTDTVRADDRCHEPAYQYRHNLSILITYSFGIKYFRSKCFFSK